MVVLVPLDLATHQSLIESLGYGKRLPGAIYILRPTPGHSIPEALAQMLSRAETAATPDPAWNLLKLHTDAVAITFLTYSAFDEDPHPALAEATKINLK